MKVYIIWSYGDDGGEHWGTRWSKIFHRGTAELRCGDCKGPFILFTLSLNHLVSPGAQ